MHREMNGRSDLEDSDEDDVVRKTLQQLEEAHASEDGLDEDVNEEGGDQEDANDDGDEEEEEKNGEVRQICLALSFNTVPSGCAFPMMFQHSMARMFQAYFSLYP